MPTYYAQLDDAGRCVGVAQLMEPVDDPRLVEIAALDNSLIGLTWSSDGWVDAPVDTRPELVVTSLTCSDPQAMIQIGDVTCAVGSTVTASAELRAKDGSIIPMSATFRMPLVARDGRERVALARLVNGSATISVTLSESGVWVIDEQTINAGLPPEMQMRFARHEIYVVQ